MVIVDDCYKYCASAGLLWCEVLNYKYFANAVVGGVKGMEGCFGMSGDGGAGDFTIAVPAMSFEQPLSFISP